eukprot:GHVR01151649.1.p1 GENE.GHVR01151649.1~~GHVR01151649.1.p1  ORF type:complete len:235 (+),score=-6.07 GHVR01151649.1:416-1120(+)
MCCGAVFFFIFSICSISDALPQSCHACKHRLAWQEDIKERKFSAMRTIIVSRPSSSNCYFRVPLILYFLGEQAEKLPSCVYPGMQVDAIAVSVLGNLDRKRTAEQSQFSFLCLAVESSSDSSCVPQHNEQETGTTCYPFFSAITTQTMETPGSGFQQMFFAEFPPGYSWKPDCIELKNTFNISGCLRYGTLSQRDQRDVRAISSINFVTRTFPKKLFSQAKFALLLRYNCTAKQ